jgi:hypothetical protein
LLAAIGFGVLTQVGGVSGLAVLVAGSVMFSLGIAPTVTLSTDLIVGTAHPERAGAASGISETGTEFGGALGSRSSAASVPPSIEASWPTTSRPEFLRRLRTSQATL